MALLYESEVGYLIYHKKHLEETYGIGFKKEYFDVSTPFLKDQEAESKARQLESGLDIKRNRKRKLCQSKLLPIAESDVNQFLQKLQEFFCEPPTAKDYYENNKSCRNAVEQFMQTTTKIQDTTFEHDHFNPSDKIETIEILSQTYIIPQKCQFYKTDISNISCLTLTHQKFSLIVMDPPWSNRFVKRKKESSASHSGYHFMGDEVLAALPIDQLCDSRTLVAIWCTNSPSHLDYLLHTMLPKWKLKHVATWFWIKVTKSGQLICPWNNANGKHPFERIVFARPASGSSSIEPFPDRKFVVSVPCAIHSFKPPLERILNNFIDNGLRLELFARSLLPNFISWGNQLPLLQNMDLFENQM